jgi:hypothetical protein
MNECLARSVRQRREDDDSDDEASLPHQNVEQISAASGIYWIFFISFILEYISLYFLVAMIFLRNFSPLLMMFNSDIYGNVS